MYPKGDKMEKYKRNAIQDDLTKYDLLAKEHGYIEICTWHNGEGFDVAIQDKPVISLTWGEFDAIKKLIKRLNKED